MSLPAGAGYAEIEWAAPSADVSGFSVILDAETKLGGLTSFTDDIDTTDGARGRIAQKSTGDEYAFDWIADDVSTDLGLIRFYADIVLAASGADARTAQIYAPNTRNTAYAAGDTYGQYNAYGSTVQASYPFGGGDDRTSNQNNLTMYGSPTVGGDTVFGFPATNYDGATQYGLSAQLDFGGEINASMFTAFNADALSGGLGGQWDNGLYWVIQSDGDILGAIRTTSGNAFPASSDGPVAINASHTACLTYEPGSLSVYVDGIIKATASSATGDLITPNNDFQISGYGGGTELFNGGIAFYEVYFDAISSGYQSYLTSQISDNSTFWGSPTWVSGSTGTTILADIVSMESYILSPLLSAGAVFSSSIQKVDIDALKESFAAGATISPGIQTINVDYLGAILAAGASIPANIQSIDIAPFIASFQTGNSISAELVSVTMTPQQAEFLSGVVGTQGLQSLAIDVLTPSFLAETLIIAPITTTTVNMLAPVFDIGGDYIRAGLLTVDTGYFAPSFASGASMVAGLQTIEFQFLDATLAELGKITGLMKVSFSGAVPGTDFTGAVPGVILIGEVD